MWLSCRARYAKVFAIYNNVHRTAIAKFKSDGSFGAEGVKLISVKIHGLRFSSVGIGVLNADPSERLDDDFVGSRCCRGGWAR